MSKMLRLILGFGIGVTVVGTIAMRLVVHMRQQTYVIPIYLSPVAGRDMPADAAQRCAKILDKRIGYVRRRFRISRSKVAVAKPDRLTVELVTHLDVEPLKRLLTRRYAMELRLVRKYDFDPKTQRDIPPDAQVLDEVQRVYSTERIGEIDIERTPRLVERKPELVIEQLRSAKFSSRGFRRDPLIEIEMNEADSKRFAEITAQHRGSHLAVVIDGDIRTAPLIQAPITGGRAYIYGINLKQDARDLAAFLDMGALPCVASLQPR